MTLSATVRRAGPFSGNDVTTVFPFTFRVFASTDLLVNRTTAGVTTTLVLTTNYSVALNPDQNASPGGSITLGVALATGSTLVIVGNLPYDQPLDLPSGGNFSPGAQENAFDRAVMQIQQLKDSADSSLRVPLGETVNPFPAAAGRVNSYAGFDSVGAATIHPAPPGTVGNFTVTGNTALGDAIGDTLSVSGAVIKNATGNWVIPAPSSGVTISAVALNNVMPAFSAYPAGTPPDPEYAGNYASTKPPASGQHINLVRSTSNAWSIGYVYNTTSFAIGVGQATDSAFTAPAFQITTAGNVIIAAPSSGPSLSSTSVGSNTTFAALSSDTTGKVAFSGSNMHLSFNNWFSAGAELVAFGVLGVGTTNATALNLFTNSVARINVAAAGNVTIAAPSAGVGLTQTGFAGSDTTVLNGGTSGSFRVTDRGLPYGTAIHNNAGAVTGPTNQYIASGTYTPTLTNNANLSGFTTNQAQWMRVGNVVTVSGFFTATETSVSTLCQMRVALPIASAFTVQQHCCGAAGLRSATVNIAAMISADFTNDEAQVSWYASGSGTAVNGSYTFTYLIL